LSWSDVAPLDQFHIRGLAATRELAACLVIHNVLKPGGSLAIFDAVAGDGRHLLLPVRWARQPENGCLPTSAETRQATEKAGFIVQSRADQSDVAAACFAEQQATRQSEPTPSPLALHMVMGPEFAAMVANLDSNFREGKTRLLQGVVKRG
jgi:MPBQ/MSBQ methyltransferase